MATRFSQLGTVPLRDKAATADLIPPQDRFAAAPDERANWPVRRVVEEMLANKVSLFHGHFQIEGVAVGLMMFAGADAARLMRLAGAVLAAELTGSGSKEQQQPTGPTPKEK